jgi:hypothetical protein
MLNVYGWTPFFREELDHQRAQANYQRLHAKGKTEEARADLARLAIIKQQRAEAAKRREEEKKGIHGSAIFSVIISIKISMAVKRFCFPEKEALRQTKTAQVNKALGKKT